MADRLDLLLEAERRGLLPPDKIELLIEARRRGLIEEEPTPVSRTAPSLFRETTGAIQAGIEQFGPEIGGIVGGTAGALVGKTPQAAMGFAGFGRAAGRGLGELTRPFLTGEPSAPPAEAILRGGEEVIRGAAGEALGLAGAAGTLRAFGFSPDILFRSPLAKAITPETRRVQTALDAVGGGRLTPAQMTESRFLDVIENITESSLLGGGKLLAVKQGPLKVGIPKLAQDLLDDLGTKMGTEGVSRVLTGSREVAILWHRAIRRVLYQDVDQKARGIFVDTDDVVRFIGGMKHQRSAEKALAAADLDVDELLRFPTASGRLSNETPFTSAQEARSRLRAVARRLTQPQRTAEDHAIGNVAAKMGGLINDAMEKAGRAANPEALAALRVADTFTREGVDRLENEPITKAFAKVIKEPSQLEAVFLTKAATDRLQKTKAAVDPRAFELLQGRLLTSILQGSRDAATGRPNGRALLESLKNLGEDYLQAAFTPTQRSRLREFAEITETIQRKSPEGTGVVFIKLMQAGAAFQVISEPIATVTGKAGKRGFVAATILVAPAILGKILSSERGSRLLLQGMRAGPATDTFFRSVGQIMVDFLPEIETEQVIRSQQTQPLGGAARLSRRPASIAR